MLTLRVYWYQLKDVKMILENHKQQRQLNTCGFAYKVVGLMKGTSKQPIVYRGQDNVEKFVECMVQEQEDIEQKFKHCEPMLMTGSEWQSFKKAKHCHICKKELGEERVRDHCHVTGKFRGAAHNECSINN
jgi:hypothetical protein